MKKIIFMDLDLTLLKSDGTVSEGNKRAVHEALDAGNCAVIASGRAVPSIRHIRDMLDFYGHGCYIAAYNGAQIYDCRQEKMIAEFPIPSDTARYLYQEADRWKIHIHTYSEHFLVSEHVCEELLFYTARAKMPYRLEPREKSLARSLPKVLLMHSSHRYLKAFEDAHRESGRGRFNSFFSDPYFLEYCGPHTSKGDAVRFLCSYLDIPFENSIAVGDEENDISMIRAAHLGVAMRNAIEKVKQAADIVTEADHDHDGVAEIIRKFML